MDYFTMHDMVRFDTAMSSKADREDLLESYKNTHFPGIDEWAFKDTDDFESVRWVRKRHINLLNLKLEYMGEIDVDTVLLKLVRSNNEEMATYYANRSKAIDVDRILGATETCTLLEASKSGYLTVVERLLERGGDVNKANSLGETPLYWASRYGYVEVAQALLGAKAEVNKGNYMTPLHCASVYGHLEVVRVLLGAEADVNMASIGSLTTPLHWASQEGHLEVVRDLLDAHAKVNKRNSYDDTPLSIAISNNHTKVAALLRESGASQ